MTSNRIWSTNSLACADRILGSCFFDGGQDWRIHKWSQYKIIFKIRLTFEIFFLFFFVGNVWFYIFKPINIKCYLSRLDSGAGCKPKWVFNAFTHRVYSKCHKIIFCCISISTSLCCDSRLCSPSRRSSWSGMEAIALLGSKRDGGTGCRLFPCCIFRSPEKKKFPVHTKGKNSTFYIKIIKKNAWKDLYLFFFFFRLKSSKPCADLF